MNAYGVVKGCTVGIDELDEYANVNFGAYPNPFEHATTLHYDLTTAGNYHKADIVITDLVGAEIKRISIKDKANTIDLNSDSWTSGMYNCSLLLDGKPIKINKLIIL